MSAWRTAQIAGVRGFSRIDVQVEGMLPGGAPFRRTAIRTVAS